jgi:hypothetical protein
VFIIVEASHAVGGGVERVADPGDSVQMRDELAPRSVRTSRRVVTKELAGEVNDSSDSIRARRARTAPEARNLTLRLVVASRRRVPGPAF